MATVQAEISGPVLSNLQHTFAQSKADLFAVLLGSYSVLDYSESTDLVTRTERSITRLVVENLVIGKLEEFVDLRTGILNQKQMKVLEFERDLKFLGVLKFGARVQVDMPSYLDRRIMTAFYNSSFLVQERPLLYVLVGDEITSKTLSIKTSMISFLVECKDKCEDGPWSGKIPLTLPNLGTGHRVEYLTACNGSNGLEEELLTGLLIDVNEVFLPLLVKFKEGIDQVSDNLTCLVAQKVNLLNEVEILLQQLNNKMEETEESYIHRSLLQGGLITALQVLQKTKVNDVMKDKMESLSLKLVLSEDEDMS